MSYSSIYELNANYEVWNVIELHNSWLYSPMIWDELFFKYCPEKVDLSLNGEKIGIMSIAFRDKSIWNYFNDKMNSSQNINDRILYELAMQQCFEKKDYLKIANALEYGIKEYFKDSGEHIKERWEQMARIIKHSESEYIIHKNTSCDDGIEVHFKKYNADDEESESCSLKDSDYLNTIEFVKIDESDEMSFELAENRFKKSESEE